MGEIIWAADDTLPTKDFKRRVFRAFTDHFKRAYNNTEHTEVVGESLCDCQAEPIEDDCEVFCECEEQ